MKKKRLGCIELKIPCRKMVLIMKLSFFLFFCFLFQVQATVNAQLQTVSLHLNGASVLEGIRQLKKQTALDFFFSNDFVDVDRKMSLQLKNVYLEDALDQLLGGGYDYIFTDSRVIIKRAAGVTASSRGIGVDRSGQRYERHATAWSDSYLERDGFRRGYKYGWKVDVTDTCTEGSGFAVFFCRYEDKRGDLAWRKGDEGCIGGRGYGDGRGGCHRYLQQAP